MKKKPPAPTVQQLVADIELLIAYSNERAPGNNLVAEVNRMNPDALRWLCRIIFLESSHIQLFRTWTTEESRRDAAAERIFDSLHAIRRWETQVRRQLMAKAS